MRDYVVLDIETTGIGPDFSAITEIGAAKIVAGEVIGVFDELINPMTSIPPNIVDLTGISNDMVKDKRTVDEVLVDFIDFCEDYPILGHNVMFDFSFLKTNAMKTHLSFEKKGLDTLELSRRFLVNQPSYSLTNLLVAFDINRDNAHRGYDDALATHKLYELIYERHYSDVTARHFVPKQLLYKPKKQSAITERQKKFLLSLIKKHKVEMDYVVDDLSKSEASKKIDQILTEYGRSF